MSKNTGTSELINYFDLGVNGDVGIAGSLDINTIANATTDTDTFLVSDTGIIKYRTGAQLLSDIGAAPAVAGGYVPYTGATTNVDLGVYNLTASAIIANGSGSNSGIVHLESNAIHSLVNGYGSIASGTTNQFNLYQTTGAGVFRGAILSLNSITEFATRTFTLPDADGTIALTSNIPANAVGGTGTSGTIPVFTGSTTIGNSIIQSNATQVNVVGNGSQLLFDSLGSAKDGGIQYVNDFTLQMYNSRGVGSSIYLGNNNLDLNINPSSNPRLRITSGGNVLINSTTDNGARLQVSGTATFSSSVAAQGFQMNGTGGYGVLAKADGINSAANGAYIGFVNNASSRYFISQLDTNNDINYYYFNGASWSSSLIKFTNTGAGLFSSNLFAGGSVLSSPSGADTIIGAYGAQDCSLILQDAVQLWELYVNDDFYINRGSTNVLSLNRTTGAATFSSSVTTGGNINVNSDGIFINRSSSGEPYVFFQKNGVNRGSIYGVTGGGLRMFDESDNQVLTITGTNVLIGTTTNNGAKLQVSGNIDLPSGANRSITLGSVTNYNYRLRTDGDDFVITEAGVTDRLRYSYTNVRWTITGGLTVSGSLSKGSGSFKIDHPLPEKKDTHQLVHSFIEGPKADLIYRGKLTLINGKAQANIDESSNMTEGTFDVLCRDVQCFTTNETGWDLVKGKVLGNVIYIESQNTNSTDEISWMVIGERKDKHMIDTDWTDENGKVIVEPLKK